MQEPLDRLRFDAVACRELAGSATTPQARDVLADLAEEYEQQLASLTALDERRRPAFKWPLP